MSIETLRRIVLALLLGLGALGTATDPVGASTGVRAVGWSSTVDTGAGTVSFAIEFDGPPDFFATDQFGRAQDSFQLSVGPTLIRGGEIARLGLIPIRCETADPCPDPLDPQPDSFSGGWGPVRAVVPYTLVGNVVRFNADLDDLLVGPSFPYSLLTTNYGATSTFAGNQLAGEAYGTLVSVDSDSDGVPDVDDAFPSDPTRAVSCLPGLFGAFSCEPAPMGYYVPIAGQLTATPCAPGTFSAVVGAFSCEPAPMGYYVPIAGQLTATACAPGTFSGFIGMVLCQQAPAGTFVDTYAAVAPTPCSPGTTSSVGATSCIASPLVYTFSGFGAPVDPAPTVNSARAGQTVPLKFRVTDAGGAPVTTLSAVSLTVASLACTAGAATDAIDEYAAGASGLQNLGDGNYQFNWKTPKGYTSSCKTIRLDLGDGVAHTALFQFIR